MRRGGRHSTRDARLGSTNAAPAQAFAEHRSGTANRWVFALESYRFVVFLFCSVPSAKKGALCSERVWLLPRGGSRLAGVSWDKRKQKWFSQIQQSGKRHFLGYFEDKMAAARCGFLYLLLRSCRLIIFRA